MTLYVSDVKYNTLTTSWRVIENLGSGFELKAVAKVDQEVVTPLFPDSFDTCWPNRRPRKQLICTVKFLNEERYLK